MRFVIKTLIFGTLFSAISALIVAGFAIAVDTFGVLVPTMIAVLTVSAVVVSGTAALVLDKKASPASRFGKVTKTALIGIMLGCIALNVACYILFKRHAESKRNPRVEEPAESTEPKTTNTGAEKK